MELQDNLPPGWEIHKDQRGPRHLMNHYSKGANWDDLRTRARLHGTPLHVTTGEYIPLQHGSPDLKRNSIYPSQPSPIPAFQMPGQYSPKYIPLQEFRAGPHMSPLSVRTARVQDSMFMPQDPEESVIKIGSMFPTVSDTHIRLLLKKYHNREAVVISALQVEKHPIATPGPFATPPPTRSIHIPLQMTPPLGVRTISRTSSPTMRTTSTNSTYTGSPRVGEYYRSSPRPHSSPKLKLRYMKSIFPQAEETIILDVLTSNDNNIQKASDNLKEMGFNKKDTTVPKKPTEEEQKIEAEKIKEAERANLNTPPPLPKLKTTVEKEAVKASLQKEYNDIPEHVISIALESVHFDEDRANQILKIMVQEDNKIKETQEVKETDKTSEIDEMDCLALPVTVPASQSRQSLKSLLKEKPECNKTTFSRVIEETTDMDGYKSKNLCNTKGSDPNYVKGANEKLLLEDYVKWQGPNPHLTTGANKGLAKGPNEELLLKKNYKPCGPNPQHRKGAVFGLAKGSIFSQLKVAMLGESRGK